MIFVSCLVFPDGSRGAPDKLEPVSDRLTGPLHDQLLNTHKYWISGRKDI